MSPRNWVQHSEALVELLQENLEAGPLSGQSAKGLYQFFLDSFTDVQRRNEAMLFRDLTPRVSGSLSSALSDIKVSEGNWITLSIPGFLCCHSSFSIL